MKVIIRYPFIKLRLMELGVNLKYECEKHDINYSTVTKLMWEKRDTIKLSQLAFFATICECDIEDLIEVIK